jgi:hypothetical protein
VQRRLEVRLAGQLALELPLMGLVYLLVPLLWLDGLAAGRSASRLLLAATLGLFGTMVLVSVWVHRLRPSGVLGPGRLGVAAAAWFLVAGLPGLLRRPEFLLAGVLAVGLAAWGLAGSAALPSPERRFEVPTLRRVAPVFAVYLVLMATWPWGASGSPRFGIGFLDLRDEPGPLPLVQLVEAIAAFTVLGYLLAEYRSRRDESLARAAAAASLGALAVAAALELARAFHPLHGASLLRALLLAAAGGAGGAVYVQWRDGVLDRVPRSRAASG